MKSKILLCGLGASLLLPACTSTPREFVPTLAQLPADAAKYEADYAYCEQLLVERKLDLGGSRVPSAVAATGAVAGAGAAGGMAASTAVAGTAIAAGTLMALPIVGVGAALGAAKTEQNRKEMASRWIMTGCLRSRGYEVTDWKKVKSAGAGRESGSVVK